MGWRNCQASMTLVAEINQRWPGRDKGSDGTIGDAAHASRQSDHNPWVKLDGVGVVRARDIDKDGIDAPWLAEHLRKLGAAGDPRLAPGGYVIFNRRITNPDFRSWRAYTGSNPHTSHIHVSFSTVPAGFDSTAPWGIATAPGPRPRPAPAPRPTPVEDDVSVQNILLDGTGEITVRLPVGNGAIATSRAWISANLRSGATRPGRVRWWFQGASAGISRRDWTELRVVDGLSSEVTDELPPGTRKINIQYEMPDGGTVCLEAIR